MNQLLFWNNWQTPYKQLYWALLGLFLATVTFFLVAWSIGLDVTFPWETYIQGKTVKITIDSIKSGPFQLPLEVDSYLLTESFQGGTLTIYKWPAYVFVAVLAFIFTLAIACITTLTRFWYLVGMGLVVTFFMSLQLEHLQLFGSIDKLALIGVFVIYLPLSYYYQSINKNVLFSTRLMVFSLIIVFVGLVVYFAAEVQYPFVHLAVYGYTAPVIISILFILMIGHQILTGFMYIITANNNSFSKNSLTHFLIITTVYLLNLLVIVLNEIQYLHWEFINIHPFVFLLISSLIGIVFYRHREETYQHIYKFQPIGGFIYLMLASICFFTIGYYLFSANDAIIEVFEDFILYAHFGYGLMFFVYIVANFLNPLKTNKRVSKVLYKPQNMPYFTYRFAGTIVVLAFLFASNYNIPVYHAMSTYYNGIGDLHLRMGEPQVAKGYYRKGKSLDYGNHRANYTLGAMARDAGDNANAAYYFNEAMRKRPTPQVFVNMSNIYLEEGKFFDGLFTIKEGENKFPTDDRIKINLGLLYDKANEVDSAYTTFKAGRHKSVTEKSANVNILALINKGDYIYDVDSIIDKYIIEDHVAMISNGFALYNANQQFWDKSIVTDTVLNLLTGYRLYNLSINNTYGLDSNYLSVLPSLAMIPKNIVFREQLLLATALGYYYHLEVGKAFRLMDQLANNYPVKSGYYFYLLGLWSLDQDAPLLAVDFFKKSQEREYAKARLALAIAQMEAGLVSESKDLWDELSIDVNLLNRQMAERALQMLSRSKLDEMNDAEKYWYWKYQVSKENEVLTQEVIDAISDFNYKSQMHIDLVKYFIKKGDKEKVAFYGDASASINSTQLNEKWSWTNIEKMDFLDRIDSAKYAYTGKSSMPKSLKFVLYYYDQRFANQHNDTTNNTVLFEKTNANPFFEQGIIRKAEYLSDKDEQMEAYNVLLNALEVNPYAVGLLKQYIFQCAVMDFDRFGDHALEELQSLVSSQEYYTFRNQYEEKLKASQLASGFFDD